MGREAGWTPAHHKIIETLNLRDGDLEFHLDRWLLVQGKGSQQEGEKTSFALFFRQL